MKYKPYLKKNLLSCVVLIILFIRIALMIEFCLIASNLINYCKKNIYNFIYKILREENNFLKLIPQKSKESLENKLNIYLYSVFYNNKITYDRI
ncbi:hypothetical protein FDC06_13970 [Clostridium botulinum]|uniref:Membrane protein n=1 Tax=Clostridium botulinum (strain Hall / ATCC 3502 / NCTC 13319 / Type A) TaxID=441771 RepID=A5I1F5_CLOBH|nr:hypothetical protein DB732_07360 [Clostridium botulinum]CAL82867.1 putative membrane protein [Clostridium botulinum A str. ATCC 3502]AWB30077.1 hypothetical protein DBN47_07340 [Clostridium botulinum]EGT5616446.1 hypothetical protein [Clostridium botulinum]EGT5623199.1 hypothetical protein [Clostridium botulinum]